MHSSHTMIAHLCMSLNYLISCRLSAVAPSNISKNKQLCCSDTRSCFWYNRMVSIPVHEVGGGHSNGLVRSVLPSVRPFLVRFSASLLRFLRICRQTTYRVELKVQFEVQIRVHELQIPMSSSVDCLWLRIWVIRYVVQLSNIWIIQVLVPLYM